MNFDRRTITRADGRVHKMYIKYKYRVKGVNSFTLTCKLHIDFFLRFKISTVRNSQEKFQCISITSYIYYFYAVYFNVVLY